MSLEAIKPMIDQSFIVKCTASIRQMNPLPNTNMQMKSSNFTLLMYILVLLLKLY